MEKKINVPFCNVESLDFSNFMKFGLKRLDTFPILESNNFQVKPDNFTRKS
jgi:hypothetical protein